MFIVPALVKFESVVMFCVVFTLHVPGAVPVQVVPVPLPNEVTPVLVIVSPEPITDWPAVTLMPVPFEMVPVATCPKVFTPVTYGSCPCVRFVVVERPPKVIVFVERMSGHVKVSTFSLPLNVL